LFYGWAKNSDLEIPTTGWPGCGEGNAQVWSEERSGPYVTLGVLDIYVYGSPNSLRAVGDPRVDYGEWCDGTMPRPICLKRTKPDAFGAVGFGIAGYNPCFVTPVRLSGFSANATEGGILLEWTSAGSEEFSHFFVHRCIADRNGDYLMLSVDPILGDAGGEWSYSYLDADVTPGTLYYYKLEGIEDGGGGVFFGPYGAVARDVNTECRLSQNVPNPFSRGSATTIHYSVRRAGGVSIRILDAAGRLVATISAAAVPGDNWSTWDGRDTSGRRVSSGVYFYKIEAEGLSAERKMLVVD
jgi:hypothetical protein